LAHARRARRENGDVGAALALQPELVLLDALADFVVGHFERSARRHGRLFRAGGCRGLLLAEAVQVLGFGRVVAVAIDNHGTIAGGILGSRDATGRGDIVKPVQRSDRLPPA
jgi:hypothetical protein